MKVKCISITDEQEESIQSQSKRFNLSKFVQSKLEEYFKILTEYKEFMEEKDND